ncbi:hypothetical protein GYB62_01325, partial [bacterium]|nr:hypothetical protein [bacterium]
MSDKYRLDSNATLAEADGWFIRTYQKLVLDHPGLIAILLSVLLVFFAINVPNYKIDASSDSLVLEGDEDLKYFRELIKRYGSEDYLIVAYSAGQTVFDEATLSDIAALRDDLAQVRGVSSVVSILDVPLLYSP